MTRIRSFADLAHAAAAGLTRMIRPHTLHDLRVRNDELALEVEERKRALEALARSEERLRLAMEATALGTFEWDVQNDRLQCSHNVRSQLGFVDDSALTLAD